MTTAIATIVIFLIMISLHEFGHFIFGKILGFNVLEYAIGFGPQIFKYQGKKTLYSLRVIPFGGYCKFAGEDGENTFGEGDFNQEPCWERIIVLSAGAVFNIILGFIIFIIFMFSVGRAGTNIIDNIYENSYMYQSGARAGDKIIEINGRNIDFYNDIHLCASEFTAEKNINMTVLRNGEKFDITFKPSETVTKIKYYENDAYIEESINGKIINSNRVTYSEDFPKDVEKIGMESVEKGYIMGFVAKIENISVLNVIPNSYYMTKYVVKLVYKSVWDLITGQVGVDQLSGPIGIVTVVNEAVHSGKESILYLLNLTALLTINLGIFNLLPLPALDGGRIIFVLYELITKKPVPPEKEGLIHSIGFILLMLLMVFVAYQDIIKLF